MLSARNPLERPRTVYDRYAHANSVLASVLYFFTSHIAKQNGTRNSVLGEIILLD